MVQLPAQSRTNLDQGCSGPCLVKFCTFPRMESPQPHWAPVPGFEYAYWENFFPSTQSVSSDEIAAEPNTF